MISPLWGYKIGENAMQKQAHLMRERRKADKEVAVVRHNRSKNTPQKRTNGF